MSSSSTPRASLDDGRRLYEQRGNGPAWTVDSGEEGTDVTPGSTGDTTSSGTTMQSGEDLYRRRHGG